MRQLPPDEQDQQTPHPKRDRRVGYVVDCNGTHAIIAAEVEAQDTEGENFWTVGQLISIATGANRIVGQCFKVVVPDGGWQVNSSNQIRVHVELVGEIQEPHGGKAQFSSGITGYPAMGAVAHRIRSNDLEAVYRNSAANTIRIGHLTQEPSLDARIDLDKLLSRHFAVVGSTGVGKSTTVSLILRKVIEKREDIRVILLDPHNEFGSSFGQNAVIKDARTLQLPFWLFRFDEFAEVIFRGQKAVDSETELLRDLVAEAKERFAESDAVPGKLVRKNQDRAGYTADSPVPFRIRDLLKIIDERLGQLDGKHEKPVLKTLSDRVNTISRDPRFAFMFGQASAGGDRLKSVISEIFRTPNYGKAICIIEMSALPSEVVNSVASVLCRLAFDLAMTSSGALQTLVVCEEAHRYIPADPSAGFWPTRQAVARIAKEGRKYGVYLGIITQRPSELDPTILSQCNTIFAMRLANRADQQIIGGAITNGAQSTVGFLASIQNRECIAFGEAISTPMRLTFDTIEREFLPGNNIQSVQTAVRGGMEIDLGSIIQQMRGGHQSPEEEKPVKELSTLPQRESGEEQVPVFQDQKVPSSPAAISRASVRPEPSAHGHRIDREPSQSGRSERSKLLDSFRVRS